MIPYGGLYTKPLTELALELDELAKAYNGLASDCTSKAKEAKRAAAVERRRYDNLKDTLRMLFGFRV